LEFSVTNNSNELENNRSAPVTQDRPGR
jgi:hypothetical protein